MQYLFADFSQTSKTQGIDTKSYKDAKRNNRHVFYMKQLIPWREVKRYCLQSEPRFTIVRQLTQTRCVEQRYKKKKETTEKQKKLSAFGHSRLQIYPRL